MQKGAPIAPLQIPQVHISTSLEKAIRRLKMHPREVFRLHHHSLLIPLDEHRPSQDGPLRGGHRWPNDAAQAAVPFSPALQSIHTHAAGHLHVTFLAGCKAEVERSHLLRIHRIHRGLRLQQKLHQAAITLRCGIVQRHAVLVGRLLLFGGVAGVMIHIRILQVHVCLCIEKQLDRPRISTERCQMEWGSPRIGVEIHIRPGFQ
mmetsp:Transcript_5913/g.10139  ORF Transcript_5913/g.10139 Transcript_5913/m.10139 type:complete len:204 (-) Transcript_5913:612-1223(-)